MLRRIGFGLACLAVAVAPALTSARAADAFTPAQRAEIVKIVRDALKQDPSILRDSVAALQEDDARQQAEQSRQAIAAKGATLVDSADPVGGNPAGDVTVVEFFDIRCPYCRRMEPTMATVLGKDHGVRIVYKDLPILGPASVIGSKALLAAHRQGKYEALRDALMGGTPDITKAVVQAQAEKLGLDWPRLQRDMDDPAIQLQLDHNVTLAQSLGIQGTPALIIGKTLLPGAVDLSELQKTIAGARADQKG